MFVSGYIVGSQVQDAVSDLLRPALVPELSTDIPARAAGHVQLMLVPVAALGAFPDQFATVLDDLDLAVVAAHLAVITLGVQLCVHDVVVDEPDQGYDGGDVILHIRHFDITDCQGFS